MTLLDYFHKFKLIEEVVSIVIDDPLFVYT